MTIVMSYDPHPALENVALASGAPLRLGPSHGKAYPGVNFEVRHANLKTTYRGARLGAAAPFLGLGDVLANRAWPLPSEKVRRTQQLVHFNKPRQDELLVASTPRWARPTPVCPAQHPVLPQSAPQPAAVSGGAA